MHGVWSYVHFWNGIELTNSMQLEILPVYTGKALSESNLENQISHKGSFSKLKHAAHISWKVIQQNIGMNFNHDGPSMNNKVWIRLSHLRCSKWTAASCHRWPVAVFVVISFRLRFSNSSAGICVLRRLGLPKAWPIQASLSHSWFNMLAKEWASTWQKRPF